MRAAIYARKSQENEVAVERQIENAQAYATKHGWIVRDAHVFADDGISGREFVNRPGFEGLLAAVKTTPRPFDRVIVMHTSRLGRDQARVMMALTDLHNAGVRVFRYQSGQEVRMETPTDILIASVEAFSDAAYAHTVALNTKEALHKMARAGHVTGTRTFGYNHVKVDDHLERQVNADEAAIVRRVFEMAAEGYGNRRIVNALRTDHVPAPAKGWSKEVIRTMLRNDIYRGILFYGKSRAAARGGAAKKRAVVLADGPIACTPNCVR